MQQLFILRHATAVPWYPRVDDFHRSLSDVGTEHARDIADWINEHLETPDDILCSPAQRTRETLAPLLSLNPGLESLVNYEQQIYGATTNSLISLLNFSFAESDRVLIVGHNPGFAMLAFEVIAAAEYDKISRLPTGTLLVVDFESGWESGAGKGVLRQKVRGKKLSL